MFIGTLGWVLFFAGLLALLERYRRPWWITAINAAGGLALLEFACLALWRLRGPFL